MGDVPQRSGPGAARFGVLAGAIIVQLILGTVYGYSIFWQPLTKQVFPEVITQVEHDARVMAGDDVSNTEVVADDAAKAARRATQQGYLKYAFSICILSFAVVMVIAGRIQDVTGPRKPAMIGAVLMGVGFALAGLINHLGGGSGSLTKLALLWGTIGFLAGAGIGFAYVCPIAALVKWFPKQKGLVSGLAVAGFGFGAYLFKGRTIGALGYIEGHGITQFFLVHGAVCFVGVTIGALLLRNPPSFAPSAGEAPQPESSWRATLRRPAFYVLWLMFFSGAMAGLMVIGIVKVFAGEQLVQAALDGASSLTPEQRAELLGKGAAAVGWLAIFNAVGRIVWGFVSDFIGRTSAFVAMFVAQAIMMFLLGTMHTELSLAVAASIVGFNFGGNFALFPSATADLFGAKNLGANYGWVFTSYGIAGVVGIAAGNAAKSMTGSYSAAFTLAAVLCLVSAALAVGLAIAHKRR